jgi:hypothetical protein
MGMHRKARRSGTAVVAMAIVLGALSAPTTATAQTNYCRIQGGGWFTDALGRKVTFAANLGHENDTAGLRDLFQEKAGEPIYVRLMLETLDGVSCSPFGPEPGDGGTLEFEGSGVCHDGSMVEIDGSLTDTGEDAGREDMQEVTARGTSNPGCTIASAGPVLGGNIRYWPIYG